MNTVEKGLLDQLSQGFLKLDQDLRIVYANASILSMMDASPEDIFNMPFPRLTARSGVVFDPEALHSEAVHVLCMHSLAGKRVYLEFSFSPVLNSEAEFDGYAVLVRDVTGKTQQMEQLKTGIETYKDFASSSAHWFWECDAAGTFTFVSGEVTAHIGYTPEEVFGRTHFDFMRKDEAERVASLFNHVAAMGIPFTNLLCETVTKAGEKRIISSNGVAVLDKEGNLKGYRGSNRDVTREVESRKKLRRDFEETIEVLNELPVGVVVTDSDLKIIQANRTACSLVGLKPGEVAGRISRDVFCTDCKGECQMAYRSGRTVDCRLTIPGKDGRSTPVLKTVAPLPGSRGQMFVQVITDLSRIDDEVAELTSYNRTLRQRIRSLTESTSSKEAALSGKRSLHWSIFQEAIDALGGVAGYIDIISATKEDDRVIQLLKYHVCALSDALDSLRNHHDSSTEKFSQEREDFLVSSLLEKTIAPFRLSSSGEGIRLRTEFSDSSSVHLNGPVRGIRRILTMLLGMAVPSSDVFVGACEIKDGENPSGLRISLAFSRHESGITGDLQEKPWITEGNIRTIEECRQYAKLLDCELVVEEPTSGGFRIWADFPVFPAAQGIVDLEQYESIRMIVFSDDPAQVELFSAMSKEAGFTTSSVTDLESLKRVFSSCCVDDSEDACVLLDGDSFLLNTIVTDIPGEQEHSRTGETRWIIATSRIESGDVGSFFSAGYSALLLKPLRLFRLKNCISRVFSTPCGSSFTTDYSL